MTPSARISAAIEVFADIEARRRPAAQGLKDWGLAHRFAGSGDRAAIAGLVYDALRRKASSAWIMGADTPRAVLLGMLARERGMNVEAIARLSDGARFAPEPLSDDEHARLRAASLEGAPEHVLGDYPEWLDAPLASFEIASTSSPRSRASIPSSTARGVSAPMIQADEALRRSAS